VMDEIELDRSHDHVAAAKAERTDR
jgi:hypothetical protein